MRVKRPRDHFGFLKLLTVFSICLLGGVAGLGGLFYYENQAFDNGAAWVAHTREIIGRTGTIFFLSHDLEWQTRKYSTLGDLDAYKDQSLIRDSLESSVSNLLKLVRENQQQHANIIELKRQLAELIHFSNVVVSQKPISLDGIDRPGYDFKNQSKIHDAIDQRIRLIINEEIRLLVSRQAAVYTTIGAINYIFIALVALTLFLLIATMLFVLYHFKKTQKAEKILLESESRFQTLINSTKDLAIFTINQYGYITDWYEGAQNIKGYSKHEVIGKNISIFYTGESIESGEPAHNLQVAAAQGSFSTEGWRVRKDGSHFWADVLITSIRRADGSLEGFTKVTRDFSLHKRTEDDARMVWHKERRLSKMKSDFIALASHEFRTPLSTILSSASLIEQYKTTETEHRREKHVERIKTAVGEMVAMLEEFLSLERMEDVNFQADFQEIDLPSLAQRTIARFDGTLKPGQYIIYSHTGDTNVTTDESIIKHILTNLLSNAIKYSPAERQIVFESCVKENQMQFLVKDEGIGISQEDQQHLFERFYRASNAMNLKGTGLGLYIVKRYTDLLKGDISVESEINHGSSFVVNIPV